MNDNNWTIIVKSSGSEKMRWRVRSATGCAWEEINVRLIIMQILSQIQVDSTSSFCFDVLIKYRNFLGLFISFSVASVSDTKLWIPVSYYFFNLFCRQPSPRLKFLFLISTSRGN